MDFFPRGGADSWDGLQAEVLLERDWLSPNKGPAISRWDSSTWVEEPLRHWNGVKFEHYGILKRWSGSAWVAEPGITTPPAPRITPTTPNLPVPLTEYTTGLWSAYSIWRRMVPGYSGPLFRVVLSGSSNFVDIGMVSGVVDTDTLFAFLGPTGKGEISILYDQSGNARDFIQTTAANRPLADFGVSETGVMNFTGASGMSLASAPATSGLTVFAKGRLPTTSDQTILESSINYNNNDNTFFIYHAVAEGGMNVVTHGTGSSYARSYYGDIRLNNNVHAYRIDRDQAAFADKASLFSAGTKLTRTGSSDVGSISGAMATNTMYLGSRAVTSLFARMDLSDLCIYNTALADSTITAISNALT